MSKKNKDNDMTLDEMLNIMGVPDATETANSEIDTVSDEIAIDDSNTDPIFDNDTINALMLSEDDYIPPMPSALEGDRNDPFDEKSFSICSNENCHLKAMCLHWRLRKQRSHMLPVIYYHDQDDCLVSVASYTNKFALDPIENWE